MRPSLLAAPTLSVLRIITAFLFIAHGSQKLLGFPAPATRVIEPMTLAWLAGVLELYGGGLLLIGVFTRPVAFVLSGFMAVAYFMAHAGGGFWPLLNKGELAVLYCFVFLYLSVVGGGSLSVDGWWQWRQARRAVAVRASAVEAQAAAT